MRNHLLTVVLGLALLACAGCGAAGREDAALSADAVHERWTAALQQNDRAAALALSTAESQPYLDTLLRSVQGAMASRAIGPLEETTVEPVRDAGAGKVGRSVWRHERATECFRTTLALVEGVWKVANWGPQPCDRP